MTFFFFLQSFGIAEGRRVQEVREMAKAAGQSFPGFTPPKGETQEQVRLERSTNCFSLISLFTWLVFIFSLSLSSSLSFPVYICLSLCSLSPLGSSQLLVTPQCSMSCSTRGTTRSMVELELFIYLLTYILCVNILMSVC